MISAAKPTKKMKRSMRSPLAASPQSIELPDGMRERILRKAYELWQERGYRDGHDLEDWLDAEVIVMEEIHEARE
ncbi:MAG TPA: DUF2934 domain-containing protein [Blastocatellia bacterium]|nr:DUF2934 domain-containing protein [Blastocatellia bacterium]